MPFDYSPLLKTALSYTNKFSADGYKAIPGVQFPKDRVYLSLNNKTL